MDSVDVAIVGAGVAGAASACAFADEGLSVLVLERRDLARDPNRGDALDSVTVSHLRRWGAADEIRRREPDELRELVFASRGGTLGRVRLPDPVTMLNHAEIEGALLETAKSHGAEVRRSAVRGVRTTDGSVRTGEGSVRTADGSVRTGDRGVGTGKGNVKATDETPVLDTDTGEIRARLVVAADGASSSIRREIGIQEDRHEYSHSLVIVHAPRPSWLKENAGWVMFHPRGGVLIVPTSPPGRCRLAIFTGPQETRDWLMADSSEMTDRLAERSSSLSELAVERGHGSHLYRLARQHARRYFAGSVALVGDSAHVTPPTGGQGMNLAVRDAASLASLAAPVLKNGSSHGGRLSLSDALGEYESRRMPPNARALARAHRLHRLRAGGFTHPLAVSGAFAFTHAPPLSTWAMRRARPG